MPYAQTRNNLQQLRIEVLRIPMAVCLAGSSPRCNDSRAWKAVPEHPGATPGLSQFKLDRKA